MSEIKKLNIHSTLWEDAIEIIGINDVVLNKLNVKGKYVPKYDLTDHAIKYDGGGFWLYIDDLEGYFKFDNGIGFLQIIFKDAEQERFTIVVLNGGIWRKRGRAFSNFEPS